MPHPDEPVTLTFRLPALVAGDLAELANLLNATPERIVLEAVLQWLNACEARVAHELRKPRHSRQVFEFVGGDEVVGEEVRLLGGLNPPEVGGLVRKYKLAAEGLRLHLYLTPLSTSRLVRSAFLAELSRRAPLQVP